MKKAYLAALWTFVIAGLTCADVSNRLNIATQDGTVNTYPYQARFTNGTVTDNNDGTVSIATGGGGSFIGINSSGNPLLTSSATILGGTNVNLSQSGSTITINATAGSTVLQSSAVAFGSSVNTVTGDTNTFRWTEKTPSLFIGGAIDIDSVTLNSGASQAGRLQFDPTTSPNLILTNEDIIYHHDQISFNNPNNFTFAYIDAGTDGTSNFILGVSSCAATASSCLPQSRWSIGPTGTTTFGDHTGTTNVLVLGSTAEGGSVISSSISVTGAISISSTVFLSGSVGSNGQVLTSGGPNTIPTWTSAGILSSTQTWTGTNTFVEGITVSTTAVTGSTVLNSTQAVIIANCSSACTQTLPTAVGISGKVYHIKSIGAGAVTIGTTSSQTIDGSTTITPNPSQWADIEVISDGSNWEIL